MRFCLHPGCGELVEGGRCALHHAEFTAPKRAVKAVRYGAAYRSVRRRWARFLASGGAVACPRCGEGILGDFDLGHQDSGELRPEHPKCNRGAWANEA